MMDDDDVDDVLLLCIEFWDLGLTLELRQTSSSMIEF